MKMPTERPEPVTEEEYAEKKRIENKIHQLIWWGQIECHGSNTLCNKCGEGYPG